MTTLTLILLAACGMVGFFMWRTERRNQLPAPDPSRPQLTAGDDDRGSELTLENARKGAVLSLNAVGPDLDDMDLTVQSRHVYRQGDFEWFELECQHAGGKAWLTVQEEDERELSLTLRTFALRELGVNPGDLKRMKGTGDGKVTYQGVEYELEETGAATFYKDGRRQAGEKFQFWEFEPEEGDTGITVARWDDDTYDAAWSTDLSDAQVKVYSIG